MISVYLKTVKFEYFVGAQKVHRSISNRHLITSFGATQKEDFWN